MISDSFEDSFGFQRVVSTASFLAARLLRTEITVRGAFAIGQGIHTDKLQLDLGSMKRTNSKAQSQSFRAWCFRMNGESSALTDMAGIQRFIELNLNQEKNASVLCKYRWLAAKFNDAIKEYELHELQPIEVGPVTC